MTRSVIEPGSAPQPGVTELTVTAEDRRVAWLATAAVGLSLVDAAIPSPLPGVKPGLANIVTLIVLARYGWGTAVWVSALRVLAGSLLLGFFLTPVFAGAALVFGTINGLIAAKLMSEPALSETPHA